VQNHPRHKETTEWEDIHRGLGNLPPDPNGAPERPSRPFDLPLDAIAGPRAPAGTEVTAVSSDAHRREAEEQSDEDEDAALRELRAKRLAELQRRARAQSSRRSFGELRQLPAEDYRSEVNDAGEGVCVVLALVAPNHEASSKLLAVLRAAARRYDSIKFVSMEASECIPGYPLSNCPTVLVYRSDELLGQFIGPRSVGLLPVSAGGAERSRQGATVAPPPDWPSAEPDERGVMHALARVVDFAQQPTLSAAAAQT
jgi:hypothetical protein